jgi:putative MATE family efflux protein
MTTQTDTPRINKLENAPIGRLLFSLAIPMIVAQFVNVLYNIVDRIFIGRLPDGTLAMAGIGVSFPIIILIAAFSNLIGMGGAPLAAIRMGQKNNSGAEKILGNAFIALISLSIVLTFIFTVWKLPLLRLFGASDAVIGYANSYMSIYVLGTVCVQLSLGLNPFINTQGFTKIGMATVTIGAIANIILDPIFIFVFGWGVQGAAIATVLSQLISAIWVCKFLTGKQTFLHLKKINLRPDLKILFSIVSLGISPFIMASTECLTLISLNTSLARYGGDIAVGAMTIMISIIQFNNAPVQGLCQGAQPIIGYNYGAKNYARVRSAFKLLFKCCVGYSICFTGSVLLFPAFYVKIFNSNTELIATTSQFIRVFFVGMLIFGAQIACQQTFLALGQARISLMLACLRKLVLLVPLIWILPNFFQDKVFAVLLAEPVSDILATITTTTCFYLFVKRITH